MDRREFIRKTVKSALAAAAIGSVPMFDVLALSQPLEVSPALAVRKGKDIARIVQEAVSALGGMGQFVSRGETVVVKPNIGWDRTPEQGANTHPQVVTAVIELCLEAGARRVDVFDRSANDPRRCYVQSGIQEAVEALGSDRVHIGYMDRRAYQEMDIRTGQELQRWSFYRPVMEADRLINLPVAKHHSISKVTLGMKNIMGVIGGNRGRLHRNIAVALADINTVVQSDLTVIDATRIMVANGPIGGRLEDVRQVDTVIASSDIVAADSMAATLFDHQPSGIPTLVEASRRGLGQMDLDKVRKV